jgi:hypothetical protein
LYSNLLTKVKLKKLKFTLFLSYGNGISAMSSETEKAMPETCNGISAMSSETEKAMPETCNLML